MKRTLWLLALTMLGAMLLFAAGCGKTQVVHQPKNPDIFTTPRPLPDGGTLEPSSVDGQCAVCNKSATKMHIIWSNATAANPNPDPLVKAGVCSTQCDRDFRAGKAKGFRYNPAAGLFEQVPAAQ